MEVIVSTRGFARVNQLELLKAFLLFRVYKYRCKISPRFVQYCWFKEKTNIHINPSIHQNFRLFNLSLKSDFDFITNF